MQDEPMRKKCKLLKKERIHDKLDTIKVWRNSPTRRAGSTPSISYIVGNLRGQLLPQATEDIAFSPRNRCRLIIRTWWKCSGGARENNFWQYLTLEGEGEFEKWRVCACCDQNAPCGQWHRGRMVYVSQVRVDRCSFSKWAQGVSSLSPNDTTAPVELRWSARVRDIKRRYGPAINLNLFVVCKCHVLPRMGNLNKSNKDFGETLKNVCSVSYA